MSTTEFPCSWSKTQAPTRIETETDPGVHVCKTGEKTVQNEASFFAPREQIVKASRRAAGKRLEWSYRTEHAARQKPHLEDVVHTQTWYCYGKTGIDTETGTPMIEPEGVSAAQIASTEISRTIILSTRLAECWRAKCDVSHR